MVERLKEAIEKARQQRAEGTVATVKQTAVAVSKSDVDLAWDNLPEIHPDEATMVRHRLAAPYQANPAQVPFDVLRTRLTKVCRDKGWRRIGISSPTKGCGKTFVSLNLAFSLGRNPDLRTILVDLDLKNPQVAAVLGVPVETPVQSLLEHQVPPEAVFLRHGKNLAFGLAHKPVRNSGEVMQGDATASAMATILGTFAPDIMLVDLPPLFVSDDVLGFMPNLDAIILVAAAGHTTASEITDCERLIGDGTQFLGVVLNKVDQREIDQYDAAYYVAPVSA